MYFVIILVIYFSFYFKVMFVNLVLKKIKQGYFKNIIYEYILQDNIVVMILNVLEVIKVCGVLDLLILFFFNCIRFRVN